MLCWHHDQLQPRNQIQGEHRQIRPGLIRAEREKRQLPQPGSFQRLDPILTPAPSPVAHVQKRRIKPRTIRQERGHPVPLRIEQARLRARMQRLSPKIDPRARRVILQLQDLGRVDHPRIRPDPPVSVQGWFPVFLLADPPVSRRSQPVIR